MAIPFLLDEQMIEALDEALAQHNQAGVEVIDFVRVGGPPDLPRGTPDPEILLWAEREGRILVSLDKRTLPGHLADHLQAGHHSPGIFIVRQHASIPSVIAFLIEAAHRSEPWEWEDRLEYIP